jgi:hypothetical protein
MILLGLYFSYKGVDFFEKFILQMAHFGEENVPIPLISSPRNYEGPYLVVISLDPNIQYYKKLHASLALDPIPNE